MESARRSAAPMSAPSNSIPVFELMALSTLARLELGAVRVIIPSRKVTSGETGGASTGLAGTGARVAVGAAVWAPGFGLPAGADETPLRCTGAAGGRFACWGSLVWAAIIPVPTSIQIVSVKTSIDSDAGRKPSHILPCAPLELKLERTRKTILPLCLPLAKH